MRRFETLVGWVIGFAGTIWFASFAAIWVLRPLPHGLWHFSLVLFGIFFATFLVGWVLGLARVYTENSAAVDEEEQPVDGPRQERPAYLFGVWWAIVSLMVWGGLKSWIPLGTVVPRDLISDPMVIARVAVSAATGWAVVKLLFAATDRGWIQ